MTLLTTIAPITFFISIVRYRLLDIDFIISRSTVYSLSIMLLLGLYGLITKILSNILGGSNLADTLLPSIVSAVVIAILFEPLRKRLQNQIDKRFFKEKYNLSKCEELITEELKNCYTLENAGKIVIDNIYTYLNINSLSIIIYNNLNFNIEYYGNINLFLTSSNLNSYVRELNKLGFSDINAKQNTIEEGINKIQLEGYFDNNPGICIILPFITQDKLLSCYFLSDQKKNKLKYTYEEIDSLKKVVNLFGNTIHRIILQKEINLKDEENKKLAELNNLKSFFVSSVSHELKTPLTSIKLFAELLQFNKSISEEKQVEYLDIIQTECDRLNRLINNVLDYSKIEHGSKKYNFEFLDLNEITEFVMDFMSNQFKLHNFEVKKYYSNNELFINADKDSIVEVLINLLSNSIKYSDVKKRIIVETFSNDNFNGVKIQDSGIGISEKDIAHIFESFYRSEDDKSQHAGGAGIGLSLVKSIMEAHNGYIDVESEPGVGSIFIIYFPKGTKK